jgi:hypothetical protein
MVRKLSFYGWAPSQPAAVLEGERGPNARAKGLEADTASAVAMAGREEFGPLVEGVQVVHTMYLPLGLRAR